jgi:predicted RNA-binding protein with PUA-like domain
LTRRESDVALADGHRRFYTAQRVLSREEAAVSRSYWLVKTEPGTYSWDDFLEEGKGVWDGVRNFQARNNMKAMRQGDLVLFYHSVTGKSVVGVAEVTKEAYPDPTTNDRRWVVVDLTPVSALTRPVELSEIKADEALADMVLARHSRLSVMPVRPAEFRRILALGKTKL